MKIAIIKIGATGDVVRTSVLLHLYKNDDVTWITSRMNIGVLPFQQLNLSKVIAIEDLKSSDELREYFDLVISLDDDFKCATLAASLNAKEIFGAYVRNNKIIYTESANEWFDMGLSSRLGKAKADMLKWENIYSYQEILFRMLGYEFNGEEYIIREDIIRKSSNVIGIEARAGSRWPSKIWNQYEQLATKLEMHGNQVIFFKDRPTIFSYIQDISEVDLLVSGDTLGMHIALALKIPVVSIFTCTSAVEIYGYGRMEKIISPLLKEAFYKTNYIEEVVNSVRLETVLESVEKLNSNTSK